MLNFFQLLTLTLILLSQPSFAAGTRTAQNDRDKQIVSLFEQIKSRSKGALDVNSYQTSIGRVVVAPRDPVKNVSWGVYAPPAGSLLTVAFRNDLGIKLSNLGFFVGNRFGSNYFELRTKYLETSEQAQIWNRYLNLSPSEYSKQQVNFQAAAKAFQLRQEELKAKKEALSDAKLMAQHQLLENYFISKNPDSKLATSSRQRGVADDDDENKYYRLFAEYLAANVTNEAEYLLLYEFQSRSEQAPGKKGVSLPYLRDLVAKIYDQLDLAAKSGAFSQAEALRFRDIRNTIHNNLNSSVIPLLSDFQKRNSSRLGAQQLKDIGTLLAQLQNYYLLNVETFSVLAPSITSSLPELNSFISQVQAVSQGRVSADLNFLDATAKLAVKARGQFTATRNIDLVHFIFRTSQLVQQQLTKMKSGDLNTEKAKLNVLLDMNYATGLLETPVYQNLKQKLNSSEISIVLTETRNELGLATLKYKRAMEPAISDWELVSTSISKYVEDGLRSSTLISLDALVTELSKTYVKQTQKDYVIETTGLGYGYLRFIPKGQTESLTKKMTYQDIPIFESMPLDLGVVAGTITEQPQTPLSHVNMKSKDRKTPNMYLKSASKNPQISKLINKLVRMELTKDAYMITEVPLAEAQQYWQKLRDNTKKFTLRSDLTEKRIRPTAQMGFKDVVNIGAKAANYAEGTKVLPGIYRDAFAVPFFYYEDFINTNYMDDAKTQTIAQRILAVTSNEQLKNNRDQLIKELEAIQNRMRSNAMVINPALVTEIKKLVSSRYPGEKIRFRSSTNSEDMPNFTGAGLYTSEGYNPKHDDPNYVDKKTGKAPAVRKTVENALKVVWSSVWNLRAWDEREHYGLVHKDVKMAILLSPGYSELANGVGVSRNIIDPKLGEGLYLNIQEGEDAVTNPDPTITPDQVLVLFTPDSKAKTKYTLKYIKYSSKTKDKPVLAYKEVEMIADALRKLHNHFYKLYHPKGDNPKFSLDVEFKIDDVDVNGKKDGVRRVYYKQARPFGG